MPKTAAARRSDVRWRSQHFRCDVCGTMVTRGNKAAHFKTYGHLERLKAQRIWDGFEDEAPRVFQPRTANQFFRGIRGGDLEGVERLMFLWARSGIVEPAANSRRG